MRRILILVGLLVAVSFIAIVQRGDIKDTLYRTITPVNKTNVSVKAPTMHFDVVTTTIAQEVGLSGRKSIPNDYGMLFVFKVASRYGFWMKDMLVPIDIIWLSDNGTVLGVKNSVSPSTYPNVFYPPRKLKYVLETRAGEARARGWSAGSQIQLPLSYGK